MYYIFIMKQSIQNRIDEIKKLAQTQGLPDTDFSAQVSNTQDSLAKVIRNKEEGDLFMAELDAVFKIAKAK